MISLCSYTISGKDILSEIKSGDVIQSAKLVEGLDHLVLPESWSCGRLNGLAVWTASLDSFFSVYTSEEASAG